jgi:PTH1 family peptidyl-tRNA hydrolase
MSSFVLIVGLGNPGEQHASTRHNVGWMALGDLAGRGAPGETFIKKFGGELVRATLGGRSCILLRPHTYMNESGRSVGGAASFFQIAPADVIVLHDELDLPFGQVRIKVGGGHAGHNGLRSLVSHLGTPDFVRVRMGIGRPPSGFAGDVADYVLSAFDPAERPQLPAMTKLAADAVVDVLINGLERAMNRVNARPGRAAGPAAADDKKAGEGGPAQEVRE